MENQDQFHELLTLIDPDRLIPVIEKGLEIEKLELSIDPDSKEKKDTIHYSTVLLLFLQLHRLGRVV